MFEHNFLHVSSIPSIFLFLARNLECVMIFVGVLYLMSKWRFYHEIA